MKKPAYKLIAVIILVGLSFLWLNGLLASSVNLQDINPLKSYPPTLTGAQQLLGSIVKVILGVVGSIAFIMFIYGGIYFLTSQGNADKISKGKNILIWSIIGLLVIFGSYVFVSFILTAIQGDSTSGNNTSQTIDKSKICGNAESGTPTSGGWRCVDLIGGLTEDAFNQCLPNLCDGPATKKCCQSMD